MSKAGESNLKKLYTKAHKFERTKQLLLREEALDICRGIKYTNREAAMEVLSSRYNELVTQLKEADPSFTVADQVDICSYIAQNQTSEIPSHILLEEVFGSVPYSDIPTIGYMQNILTDKAFLAFSDALGSAKACYYSSFANCSEALENDGVDYIILPYKTDDGILPTVEKLIDEHSLAPCLEAEIDGTSFFMLSRATHIVARPKKASKLMLSLRLDSAEHLSELTTLVSKIGATICDIFSLETEGVHSGVRISLNISDADTNTLIIALALMQKFLACGIYYTII